MTLAQDLEDQMDRDYAEYLGRVSKNKARAAAASEETTGIKLTRRQRLEKEAAVVEQQVPCPCP
jgi:hypothetical protein